MIALLFVAALLSAQTAGLSAGQIIDKSIEASGGRAAMEKCTSSYAKGILEFGEQHAVIEMYGKAPNKRLIVTNFEGYGEVKQGFDGKVAWLQDPLRGVVEQTGEAAAAAARESTFNASLRWRDLYPKAEVAGKEKLGGRDVWVVRLTPASGRPTTQYYDATTFLLARQAGTVQTAEGITDIRVDFSDYRDIGGGVKAPFLLKQMIPAGQIVIRFSEIRNNLEIEDAKFAKPAKGE